MLEELKGSKITYEYLDSNKVESTLCLSEGKEYKSEVIGSGFDITDDAISKVVQEYFNEQLSSKEIEDIPKIRGIMIVDEKLFLNGAKAPKCWVNLIEHFGFKIWDSEDGTSKSYVIE